MKSCLLKSADIRRLHSFNFGLDALIFVYAGCVYIFANNFERIDYIDRTLVLVLMACLSFYVVSLYKHGSIFLAFGYFEKLLLLFGGACLLSIFFAVDPYDALYGCRSMVKIICLFTLLHTYCANEHQSDWLLSLMCFSGILVGMYIFLSIGPFAYISKMVTGGRVGGNIMNANVLSMHTGYAAILCFWYAYYKKKIWLYIPMIFSSFLSLGGGSRKAIICLFLGIMFLYLLKGHAAGKAKNIFLMIFVIILMSFVLTRADIFSRVTGRFLTFLNFFYGQGQIDGSTIIRMFMIQRGFQDFLQSPFMGVGIANSHFLATEYVGHNYYLHNNYIELLTSVGLLGTIPYYAMWIYPLYKLWQPALRSDAEAVILETLMVIDLILQFGYVSYNYFPAYILLLAAYIKVQRLGVGK